MNKSNINEMRWHKKRLAQSLSEYFDVTEMEKQIDDMIERADRKRVTTIVDKQKESYEEGYADGYNEANTRHLSFEDKMALDK